MTTAREDGRCCCGRFVALGGECARCEHYRCTTCLLVVPWAFGAADRYFTECDTCACVSFAAEKSEQGAVQCV